MKIGPLNEFGEVLHFRILHAISINFNISYSSEVHFDWLNKRDQSKPEKLHCRNSIALSQSQETCR